MKTKALIALALAVCIGLYAESKLREGRLLDVERAEAERITAQTIQAISEMVRRTNAESGWEQSLSSGRMVGVSVLTIDLEREWIREHPILFTGSVDDVAGHTQPQYTLRMGNLTTPGAFEQVLELSLLAPRELVDSFRVEHPAQFEDYGFNNGVAIAARIERIERAQQHSVLDGYAEDILVGHGALIDMVYTGDPFWSWRIELESPRGENP